MRIHQSLLLSLCWLPQVLWADPSIYVTQQDGKVIFSDTKPGGKSTTISKTREKNIKEPQSFHAPVPTRQQVPAKTKAKLPKFALSITNPAHDSTFQHKPVDVKVQVTPRLKYGVKFRLMLNNKTVSVKTLKQSVFTTTLTGVDRGAHILKAQLLYHGKVIQETQVTFYMHRPIVKKKATAS